MIYLVDANVLSEATRPSPDPAVVNWLKQNEQEIAVDPFILANQFGILLLPAGKRGCAWSAGSRRALNLSRGHVINLERLREHLLSGRIAGASLDVFPNEPKNAAERFVSPLQNLPNVLLTPHIGGSTEEAQENIADFVSSKLLDYVKFGTTFTSVNFPKINAPKPDDADTHRLLHVHQNVPGVLSNINGIFAKNNVNVLTQYLRTNEQIGYVVADVDKKYHDSLYDDLQKVEHTIKVRII